MAAVGSARHIARLLGISLKDRAGRLSLAIDEHVALFSPLVNCARLQILSFAISDGSLALFRCRHNGSVVAGSVFDVSALHPISGDPRAAAVFLAEVLSRFPVPAGSISLLVSSKRLPSGPIARHRLVQIAMAEAQIHAILRNRLRYSSCIATESYLRLKVENFVPKNRLHFQKLVAIGWLLENNASAEHYQGLVDKNDSFARAVLNAKIVLEQLEAMHRYRSREGK